MTRRNSSESGRDAAPRTRLRPSPPLSLEYKCPVRAKRGLFLTHFKNAIGPITPSLLISTTLLYARNDHDPPKRRFRALVFQFSTARKIDQITSRKMKKILCRFLPRGARGFVPRPILTVTWLGLEDKGNFQCRYACDSPYRCEQFFAHNLHKRPKHHQENTPIHQRKKIFCLPGPAT